MNKISSRNQSKAEQRLQLLYESNSLKENVPFLEIYELYLPFLDDVYDQLILEPNNFEPCCGIIRSVMVWVELWTDLNNSASQGYGGVYWK